MLKDLTMQQLDTLRDVLGEAISSIDNALHYTQDEEDKETFRKKLSDWNDLAEVIGGIYEDAVAAEKRGSRYDTIYTARALVREVMAHGLSTRQEDLVRVQDLFGNSTIDELVALANDIGRNNADGEPDPEGSWSSIRRGTRDTFYMILFSVWNWEDAVRFYNQHTNPDRKAMEELKEAVVNWEKVVKDAHATNAKLMTLKTKVEDENAELVQGYNRMVDRLHAAEEAVSSLRAEGIVLKAKLFDLAYSDSEQVPEDVLDRIQQLLSSRDETEASSSMPDAPQHKEVTS